MNSPHAVNVLYMFFLFLLLLYSPVLPHGITEVLCFLLTSLPKPQRLASGEIVKNLKWYI